MRKLMVATICAPILLFGCSDGGGEPQVGRARHELAHPGPWVIPEATLLEGDSQWVPYTGAGPWVGESGCYPGLTPGAGILREYLYAHFPQAYSVGGYSCRPIVGNESQMSVHATGRALDIMIHVIDGEADNDLGDPVGNWLIENAEAIGIQYIIWDLYSWMAEREPGNKGKDYGGTHPHDDHLHIELSVEASAHTAPWFDDQVETPTIEGCEPIGPEGAIIEETDPCFGAFGPNEYWRLVDDAGHGGSLLWTNAFENDTPSNWARWNLVFAASGSYQVDVYVDPAWGVHRDTRYRIRHGGGDTEVVVDQSVEQEWVNLGSFDFEAGVEAYVDVLDNTTGLVEADQHIAVDAVRLTGSGYDPPEGDPVAPADPDPPLLPGAFGSHGGGIAGDDAGCSLAPRPARHGGWASLLFAAALLARRRRS